MVAAREAAGLGEKARYERLMLPKPTSPFEALLGPLDNETRLESAFNRILVRRLPAEWTKALRNITVMDLLAKEKVLTVLPYQMEVK